MKIYCCVCSKQAVSYDVSEYDEHRTILKNSKANMGGTIFCGYCARALDENGLSPEERAQILNEF